MDDSTRHNGVRPIGAYLAERTQGTAATIEKALAAQDSLNKESCYRPLGTILAESASIDPSLLEDCLRTQRADILRSIELFSSLPHETLDELAAALTTGSCRQEKSFFARRHPRKHTTSSFPDPCESPGANRTATPWFSRCGAPGTDSERSRS